MNRQVIYIIQGFLLALLFPIIGYIINKISSLKSVESSGNIIDYEMPQKSAVAIGASYKGKALFMQKCAACHSIFKDGTGPALNDFQDRGPWIDKEKLYAWIRNPSAFVKENAYTKALKEKYGSVMTAFPNISNEEIDSITEYIKLTQAKPVNSSQPLAFR